MAKISVIVPVFNAEKYLEQCIRSICDQTFSDFELLLIDDGSTDRSGDICVEFAKEDPRIHVFHQRNSGVSAARNLGLEQITGSKVCFIDADDWIEIDFLSHFSEYMQEPGNLIIQNFRIDQAGTSRATSDSADAIYRKPEFNKLFTRLNLLSKTGVCAKLYAVDLIQQHSIRFKVDMHYGEDCLFMLEYLKYTETIRYLSYAGYHYMHFQVASLSKQYNVFDSEMKAFELLRNALNRLNVLYAFDDSSKKYIDAWLALFFLRAIHSIYRNQERLSLQKRIAFQQAAYLPGVILLLSKMDFSTTPIYSIISAYLYRYRLFYLHDLYMNMVLSLHSFLSVFKNNI